VIPLKILFSNIFVIDDFTLRILNNMKKKLILRSAFYIFFYAARGSERERKRERERGLFSCADSADILL